MAAKVIAGKTLGDQTNGQDESDEDGDRDHLPVAGLVMAAELLDRLGRPRELRLLDLAQAIIDWQPIIRAPFERDLEVAVINPDGTVNALGFPCWRTFDGWLNAKTKEWVNFRPTHWRDWRYGF